MKIFGRNKSASASYSKCYSKNIEKEKDDIERSHIVTKNPIINLKTNHIHKNSKSNIGKLHIKSRRRHWTLNAIVGDCTLNGIESRRMNKAENKLQSNYTNTSVHLGASYMNIITQISRHILHGHN